MTTSTGGFYGLDTEHCRGKATQMQAQGAQLGSLMGDIQGMLDSVTWQGGNARRFLENWDSTLRPKMADSADQVAERGRELSRRVDMQEEASGA